MTNKSLLSESFKVFKEKSNLPDEYKTKKNYEVWIGHFNYYYYKERYGEWDSAKYADEMVIQK